MFVINTTQNIEFSMNIFPLDTDLSAVSLSLFLATPLLELHATHVHDSGSDLVYVVLLLLGETKHVHGLLY